MAQSVQLLATGWTVWGSYPGGGRNIAERSRLALGPTQPPIQWVQGLSRGKAAGALNSHPSSAEDKESVELYLYSPSGLSWHVLGSILPFIFNFICV